MKKESFDVDINRTSTNETLNEERSSISSLVNNVVNAVLMSHVDDIENDVNMIESNIAASTTETNMQIARPTDNNDCVLNTNLDLSVMSDRPSNIVDNDGIHDVETSITQNGHNTHDALEAKSEVVPVDIDSHRPTPITNTGQSETTKGQSAAVTTKTDTPSTVCEIAPEIINSRPISNVSNDNTDTVHTVGKIDDDLTLMTNVTTVAVTAEIKREVRSHEVLEVKPDITSTSVSQTDAETEHVSNVLRSIAKSIRSYPDFRKLNFTRVKPKDQELSETMEQT